MDQNQRQAQAILEKGWIPHERLRMALEHPNRSSYPDLLDFLLHALMLNPTQVMQLRQELAIEADSRPTVTPRPSTPATPKPAPSEADELLEIEAAYQKAKAKHPLFSPHARVDFKLLEKLGEGGMGVVHRVEDQRLGRNAALKILNCGPDNPRAVKRFLREASITARLSHPNIPPVFEQGQSSVGERYMLMKVIEGQTLGQVLKHQYSADSTIPKMSQRSLLEAFVKVCEAVAYAHSQGIIHRDLKPANIMIGEFGEVMVMDWGLAKDLNDQTDEIDAPESSADLQALAAKEGLTMAGDLLGTLGYMPPEQVEADTDEQADVFALGAILTEILSGHRSIRGESALNVLSATIKGDIKGPRAFDKNCPKELDALACLALKFKKDERLQSVNDLIADLKAYLAGEELTHYKYGLFKKSQRWVSRHPTLLMAFSLSVLLLSSVGYFQQALTKLEAEKKQSEQNEALAKKDLKLTEEEKLNKEEAETLLKEAAASVERGNSLSMVRKFIEAALKLTKNDEQLILRAAQIYIAGRHYTESKRLLRVLEKNFYPAYEALFLLQYIEQAEENKAIQSTVNMKRLNALYEKHGEKNEFTVVAVLAQMIRKEEWANAIRYSKSIAESLKKPEFYYLEGYAHCELRQFEEALIALNKSTATSDKFTIGFYLKGYILHLLKRPKEAIISINTALSLRAKFPLALFVRGQVFESLGKMDKAMDDYNQALSFQPKNEDALFARAQLKGKLLQYQAALADFERLIELRPNSAEYIRLRAGCMLSLGDFKKALSDCNSALSIDPRHYFALELRGRVKTHFKDFQGALKDFNSAISIESKTPVGYVSRAFLKAAMNDNKGAKADFDIAIRLNPKDANTIYNRGSIKLLLLDRKGAVEDYSKAIALDPNNPIFHFQRGSVLYDLKDYKQAKVDFTKSIKLQPNSPNPYLGRALVNAAQGDNKSAALDLEMNLLRNPNDPAADNRRAFILKHLGRPSKY